jgi:hypothetical protein
MRVGDLRDWLDQFPDDTNVTLVNDCKDPWVTGEYVKGICVKYIEGGGKGDMYWYDTGEGYEKISWADHDCHVREGFVVIYQKHESRAPDDFVEDPDFYG